ncbi:hypothetical protein ACEQ8H_000342 [Pleosporales sp. CAS-2024a]
MSLAASRSSVSHSEPWASQSFDDLPHAPIHSFERKPRAFSGRRTSVFNLRSRSNTAASTSPTLHSLSPSMSFTDDSWPATPHHDDPSAPRKSLFRGKKAKRLSESMASSSDHQDKDAGDRRLSVLRKMKRRTQQDDVNGKSQVE